MGQISIRLTAQQEAKVRQRAKAAGLSMAEYIRMLLFHEDKRVESSDVIAFEQMKNEITEVKQSIQQLTNGWEELLGMMDVAIKESDKKADILRMDHNFLTQLLYQKMLRDRSGSSPEVTLAAKKYANAIWNKAIEIAYPKK